MTTRVRHRAAIGGTLVLIAAAVVALPDTISTIEEGIFRAVNDLPDWIEYPGWPVMQLGSILAVPLVAIVCLALFRNWRVPGRVAIAGTAAWVAAKFVKVLVDRARPGAFLDDINLRPEWNGLGFPSGHAAVAFAIAAILVSTLPSLWRKAVWAAVVLAGILRIYVGAHLPLDIIGGWGLGLGIGALIGAGRGGAAATLGEARAAAASTRP